MSDVDKRIQEAIERVRLGIPDMLNRWLGMTPARLAEIETQRAHSKERWMTTVQTTTKTNGTQAGDLKVPGGLTALAKAVSAPGPKEAAVAAQRVATTTKKPHAADAGDLALIAQAKSYTVKLFHEGQFSEQANLTTLAEARERGLSMEATTKSTRRSMIYAVLADGRAVLVPRSYNPAPATQESDVKTTTKKKPAAKSQTERKPADAKPASAKKPADAARTAVKGATTKTKAKSKSDIVQDLLTREKGATREEMSKASGWPHVNLKTAAERAEMKLVCLDEETQRYKLVAKGGK